VTQTGFCTQYCGWHSYNSNYKYAWIGVPPSGCPCSAQSVSPNGNPPVDAAVSVIAHELEETVTDPLINAWYYSDSTRFVENGDQCAWYFPSALTLSTGAKYNLVVGGKNYYVQANWNLSTKTCRMS
jgi:hypothetical protein